MSSIKPKLKAPNASPPLSLPGVEETNNVYINLKVSSQPTVVKGTEPIYSNEVYKTQTEIFQRTETCEAIKQETNDNLLPLCKLNDNTMKISKNINLLEEKLENKLLHGQPPKVNRSIKYPALVHNAESSKTKIGNEVQKNNYLLLNRSFLPLKSNSIADDLDKLSFNEKTRYKEQTDLYDKNFLTEGEPIYQDIEDEIKSFPNVAKENKSKSLLATGSKSDNELHTLPTTSRLISNRNVRGSYQNPTNSLIDIRRGNPVNSVRYSPQIIFIMNDVRRTEIYYIEQLENALKVFKKLEKEDLPQLTCNKLVGYFHEILSFHKEEFLIELNRSETPKQFALCFVRHFFEFDLYIKREWLFSSNLMDLDNFEKYLIENHNLKLYINLTTRRLLEYTRCLKLMHFLSETAQDRNTRVATEEAVKVLENLDKQIQKVQEFKTLFGKDCDKFKECGQVRLVDKFKISINGSSKKNLLVYLCENMVIFANIKNNDDYRCVDVLSNSLIYCVSKEKNKFEIGIKGRNIFNLKAETQNIKEQWCKELKKIIKNENV